MSNKNILKAGTKLELVGMKLEDRKYYEARLSALRDYESGKFNWTEKR